MQATGSKPGAGPEHGKLLLYNKIQKLLDRYLFVHFSEDKGLLPPEHSAGSNEAPGVNFHPPCTAMIQRK